jgi:PKHD-type hydroxylase
VSWKHDYWYVKNYYTSKERKLITNFIEKNHNDVEKKETTALDKNKVSKKNTKTLIIEWRRIKNIVGNLMSSIQHLNTYNFGYVLYPYDWHYDSSKSDMYDVKLTVLVNLSEKYTGGKFHIFHGDEYVVEEFEPGTLLLFKSNLNHKVSPVLTGVRKTLTLLINGPKFR